MSGPHKELDAYIEVLKQVLNICSEMLSLDVMQVGRNARARGFEQGVIGGVGGAVRALKDRDEMKEMIKNYCKKRNDGLGGSLEI